MKMSEEEKEEMTDWLIAREECVVDRAKEVENDLTTAYLKGYADAEEKHKKRIKELEETLLKVKDKNTTLFITCRNSIPKQKVKDLIINETINISGFECIAVEDVKKLLEDK